MKIGSRIVAALGLAGVIVAVILWQWLTAPVEWGPVDSMIRQAGQNLVSCPGSPLVGCWWIPHLLCLASRFVLFATAWTGVGGAADC